MKKQMLNLGKALNKAEQREISGGAPSLSCLGKNVGDSCGTPSNPTAICCATGGDHSYLYCSQPQYCKIMVLP